MRKWETIDQRTRRIDVLENVNGRFGPNDGGTAIRENYGVIRRIAVFWCSTPRRGKIRSNSST
jgi:hypothetical protein